MPHNLEKAYLIYIIYLIYFIYVAGKRYSVGRGLMHCDESQVGYTTITADVLDGSIILL